MDNTWKNDPRLNNMSSQKLQYLTDLVAQVEKTPKDKLLPLFMNISMGSNSMNFSDQETDLLVSILTKDMPAAEKKKLDTLKNLSKKLGGMNSKRSR